MDKSKSEEILKGEVRYHPYSDDTIKTLKERKFLGCMNKCPKCNKTGEFGSILMQMESDGNWYICCGWCGEVTHTNKP